MNTSLTPEFLAARRALMIDILDHRRRGIPYPKPARRHYNSRPGNQAKAKPAAVKLQTRLEKAASLLEAMAHERSDKARFERLRQQFYSLKNEIGRFCLAHGLQAPELPLAPKSTFPGAAPRMR